MSFSKRGLHSRRIFWTEWPPSWRTQKSNHESMNEDVTLLPANDDNFLRVNSSGSTRYWMLISTIANIVLFSLTIVLVFIAKSERACPACGEPESKPRVNAALKELSSYSPILDVIDLDSQTISFDGTFFNSTSIYRRDPSPSVDAAWGFLDHDIWPVTASDIRHVHKDPAKSVKIDPKWGLGNDAYVASFGFVHQIHCLNTLRKEIHYDAYWDKPPSETHIAHRNHCLHMLLQSIMCHADVDVITYEWIYTEDPESGQRSYTPWPDFNMVKKCRNFDQLYDYLERNVPAVADELHEKIQKPADAPAKSLYDT